MVKKKISGQTIAIIVLALLLLLTVGFGAVFAYFSTKSNPIQGSIILANLNIRLDIEADELDNPSAGSGSSEILISGTNLLPNQKLLNRPLVVKNTSSAPTYLMVAYRVEATRRNGEEKEVINDDYEGCVIDLGIDYINREHELKYKHYKDQPDVTEDLRRNSKWVDYVFKYTEEDVENPKTYIYRCLVYLEKLPATEEGEENKVTVIAEDSLKLHQDLDNDYQSTELSFTFQAYVIGASDNIVEVVESEETGVEEKCRVIVENTFKSQNYEFLAINSGE